MENTKVVIRFDDYCERDKYAMRRIQGTATADSLIRLIDSADLHANPREAKVGDVTDGIQETLRKMPHLFPFMSKGLLLAAGECSELERNRFELSFNHDRLEGVLDGGHNLFAIALYLIYEAAGGGDTGLKAIRPVRRWQQLRPAWAEWRSTIEAKRSELRFLTPMEVIFPQHGAAGEDAFQSAILEVARARNTNAQLQEETKANQAGYYDFLRECLAPELASKVEWKTNDGGTIKVRDLIALAWIPLSALDDPALATASFNPTLIYSSKGECVKQFNSLIAKEGVSVSDSGPIVKLVHHGVKSALKLMSDMPKLYDQIYKAFPEAYNSTSARFGGIESVHIWDPKKSTSKDPKYLRKPACTPFYGQACEYDYPDPFILPIVWALRSLMVYRNGEVHWQVEPSKFIEKNLNDALKLYYSLIKMAKWEPNILGKASGAYELLADNFANKLR
jgi:hypothetical protein